MFQRMIEDFKNQAATMVRLTSLAAVAAIALAIMLAFLCAAAFIVVLQKYGPVEACLAGAAIFLVLALVAFGARYLMRRNQIRNRARAKTKPGISAALADPMLMTVGLQLIRTVGVKRLVPILAIAGVALGLLVSRGTSSAADDETPES